jgi:outer membrane immunogenic protein
MRRLIIVLALIGFAGRAFAADLPAIAHEPNAYIPAFPSYFQWQGFYVGGQLTAGDANADFKTSTQPLLELALRNLALQNEQAPSTWQVLGQSDARAAGFGGFLGYNAQFENAVIGLEFNYTHSNFNIGAATTPISRLTPALSNGAQYVVSLTGSGSVQIQDFATLRARLGWVADNFMPYFTFGAAVARADMDVSVTCTCIQLANPPNVPQVDFSFTQSQTKSQAFLFGYAGGAGVDIGLTRNLFGRLEYEYLQFPPVWRITTHINIARAGLALKF